ncbi:S1/P1 nuclease [Aliikangiella coralliicola]|uniref:S1/P1 nuclease n=1 Tax=Aliikangiella coralliicola TaxID=2592383 RepID=A0A545U7I1_9GAMM|nr:S1/P1 nuclease [Aliikangiella coralliicola]TQV85427.1 S1/P1 nuclease [Aliikangiella coralliicola]
MKNTIITASLFLLLGTFLFIPSSGLALGNTGHEAICEIAYLELTPKARKAVDSLLALEKKARFKTFRRACTWPDDRKDETTAKRKREHYINVPRNWSYVSKAKCPLAKTCLFTAISSDESALRNSKNSQKKLRALKYLGHWVGDIHQPFHVSFADDRGGNEIHLEKSIGCRKNLHAVWDQCIPENIMESLSLNPRKTSHRKRFGQMLHRMITAEQREKWKQEKQPVTWANESLSLVRKQQVKYCFENGKHCQYSPASLTHVRHGKQSNTRTINLTDEYEKKFQKIMTRRIQQAGVRLGALLNDIFG